jgi:hypothetical protein
MKPTRGDDAVVDLVDTILRDGAVLQADVVVTVGDVPLVGISLRAAIAGMTTMTEYGHLTEFDRDIRTRAAERHGESPTPGSVDSDASATETENQAADHSPR